MIILHFINLLCTKKYDEDYLPEIWEIDDNRTLQKSNPYGITPNIIKKSTERLNILTQRRHNALLEAGLIKSTSAQCLSNSLSSPISYYNSNRDIGNSKDFGNFRLYSYPSDLEKLANYDPNRLFKYEDSEQDNSSDSITLNENQNFDDINKKVDLNRLDGCKKKSKQKLENVLDTENSKVDDKLFTDWLQNVVKKNKDSNENLLKDKNDISTNLKDKNDISTNLKVKNDILESKKRRSFFRSKQDVIPEEIEIFTLEKSKSSKSSLKKSVENFKLDNSSTYEESLDSGILKKSDRNNSESFTFFYIPSTVKKILNENDLFKYKKCFLHGCMMFKTHSNIFNSFKKLVLSYKRFNKKYLSNSREDNTAIEKMRRKATSLLESRSDKIKLMLSKLNEIQNPDEVFKYLHMKEEKIHLNSKIIKYINECTREQNNYKYNEVSFTTCINDIKYDVTYLDLAFYTLAKYCSKTFD